MKKSFLYDVLAASMVFFFGMTTVLLAGEPISPPKPKVDPLPKTSPEKLKPIPKVGPFLINGYVTVPDGRGLKEVILKLYEVSGTGVSFIKEVETTKAGYYSIQLGEQFFGRDVKLIAKYAHFGEGAHFSPQYYNLKITDSKTSRNFNYTGPLPDLEVPQPEWSLAIAASVGFEVRGGICNFFMLILNKGEVESGRFGVKVKYIDNTGGLSKIKEKIQSVNSIGPKDRGSVMIELGPGTEEEKKLGSLESGTGRYKISSVFVDFDDSVIETNENNNRLPW